MAPPAPRPSVHLLLLPSYPPNQRQLLTLPPVLRVKRAASVWRLMRAPKQNVKEFLEKRRRATKRLLSKKKKTGSLGRSSPQSSGLNGTNMANYMYLTRTGQSVLQCCQCDTNNDKHHNYGQSWTAIH